MAEDCKGECMGRSLGDEPQTLTRYHSCGLPQLYEAFFPFLGTLPFSLRQCTFFSPTNFTFTIHLDWFLLFPGPRVRLNLLRYGLSKAHLAAQAISIRNNNKD